MNYNRIAENLIAAKALIAIPAQWTQGTLARKNGESTNYMDPEATCFCTMGAIVRALHNTNYGPDEFRLLDAASGIGNAIRLNDTGTHEEVMAMWDKAIATAQAQAVVQNLTAGKAKIEKPENWTKGVYAKTPERQASWGNEEGAFCFCSLGAIQCVMDTTRDDKTKEAEFLRLACVEISGEQYIDVDIFNDSHTHAEVLAMWDRAIELAKEAVK